MIYFWHILHETEVIDLWLVLDVGDLVQRTFNFQLECLYFSCCSNKFVPAACLSKTAMYSYSFRHIIYNNILLCCVLL